MGDVWIRDHDSRVLGPVALQVIHDLVTAGRLRGITAVSEDGEHWAPLDRYPSIAELQARQTQDARAERDRSEAAELRRQLEALRGRPPHQVFGLTADATLRAFREAFFRLVKRFYPDSLPPEASPELREVYGEIFDYLSRLMHYIERLPPTEPKKQVPPPLIRRVAGEPASTAPQRAAPSPEAAAAPPPAGPQGPSYGRKDFIGIERLSDSKLRAQVQVTEETWPLISSDPLASVASGCAFVPFEEPVALGSRVELCLRFPKASKEITATGTVISWNAGSERQPRGFGVQLTAISPDDRSFLKGYAKGR